MCREVLLTHVWSIVCSYVNVLMSYALDPDPKNLCIALDVDLSTSDGGIHCNEYSSMDACLSISSLNSIRVTFKFGTYYGTIKPSLCGYDDIWFS